ncbi:ribonuclease Z [Aerococcaceae bacterium zg-B36]|uniref:ribonuclease Z n=1 Tax=Aerococcaceae bacterium zg-252 TaxID=2796928 RepID=UPI001BD8C609|nr:ribonuclease Z [Aerococcaceae bacterium zg-B36]
MKLLFLGTGAGVPAKSRNVSSLALKLLDELNETWLFDCGEATQHQILETTLKPRKITNIFITHLHGDHIFGLPGFLSSRSFQGGDGDPLTIYGPVGIRQFVQSALRFSKSRLSYRIKFVELEDKGGVLNLSNGWQVQYLPLNHGVECFGYRIIEPDAQGELLVDLLALYNIPNGPIFGQLKRGETVTLSDGTVLDGKQFIGPERKGRIVTILGDTKPCENLSILAQNADVLVHEATYEGSEAPLAAAHFHSTNVQAATVAEKANVKQLYLNHISARYLGKEAKQLEIEAKTVFEKTRLVYDLQEYDIPTNEEAAE